MQRVDISEQTVTLQTFLGTLDPMINEMLLFE